MYARASCARAIASPLLFGRESLEPAEVGRGSNPGLKRARLAFVGERKDARVGVFLTGLRLPGTNSVGEVLRLLGDGDAMG